MKVMPLLPFLRHLRTGVAGGTLIAAGITVWRVSDEGSAGETLLALASGLAGMIVVFGPLYAYWLRKAVREAEPLPADAEVMDRGKLKWWALLGGAVFAVASVGRAADDSVVFSGVLTGLMAGGALLLAVAAGWLRGWQTEHAQELLQERTGFSTAHFVCPTRSSRRFDRVPANSDRVGRL